METNESVVLHLVTPTQPQTRQIIIYQISLSNKLIILYIVVTIDLIELTT